MGEDVSFGREKGVLKDEVLDGPVLTSTTNPPKIPRSRVERVSTGF